ncbi:MAG: ATP-dependent RecD-like DNA helicase [Desulfococcaceae bacterium]
MKPRPTTPKNAPPLAHLNGQIERITYSNAENGYTVAKVRVSGRFELVTVVGNLMDPMPGEILKMKGRWTRHAQYGEQFRVETYETAAPATVVGIRKYLGSGLIRGVGPKIAERIVDAFGEATLEVIERDIQALTRVEGIGRKRIDQIRQAWDEQKEIREVMLFLQSHGVSAAYAAKIYKFYGDQALPVVRDNPYRLAMDIFGIGFLTADRIAQKLGFAHDAPQRAEAGILHVLHAMADEGHVYAPYEELIARCVNMLQVERDGLVDAFGRIERERRIRIEDISDDFVPNQKAVYLAGFHVAEKGIARRLQLLLHAPRALEVGDPDASLAAVSAAMGVQLADRQAAAIRQALTEKVLVITGGPGTGKTTIIRAVLDVVPAAPTRVMLAAPTGRAAKRMSEATGRPAVTIHRLLKFSPKKGGFEHATENPLPADLIIVDEASMIDTVLMHHLLKAVPGTAALILVGDVHQLPSVGAGNVLGDVIDSGVVPVAALTEIFRQARQSRIVVNAHRIHQGRMPRLDGGPDHSDFFFIQREEPEAAAEVILKLVRERIPSRFGLDPVDDVQVLTPMHRGVAGAGNLNAVLQEALNPGEGGVARGQRTFRPGDKVMQIRNDYDRAVFNGDVGRVVSVETETREVAIRFDGREVVYDFSDLDAVTLAYAVSVHKAQGSEYPAVVMPILMQHFMLLQRNLLYTAVTRGRRLVVLVGTKQALAMAVKNDKTRRRCTRLRERLADWG